MNIKEQSINTVLEVPMLALVKDFMALVSLTAFGGVMLFYFDMMTYLV